MEQFNESAEFHEPTQRPGLLVLAVTRRLCDAVAVTSVTCVTTRPMTTVVPQLRAWE